MQLRLADLTDASACSKIVNEWIDNTNWMPRLHSPEEIMKMIRLGIDEREFWVIGDPVIGYLSLNPNVRQIMGLYVAVPGEGLGKLLLNQVKVGRNYLKLWSHSANTAAHKFYLRKGFELTGNIKIGHDGLEEKCFEWRT